MARTEDPRPSLAPFPRLLFLEGSPAGPKLEEIRVRARAAKLVGSLMGTNDRYVNASEIAAYVFCQKAWHLSQIGTPSAAGPEREAGIESHAAHSELVSAAAQSKAFAKALALLLLLILLVLIYRLLAS